MQLSLEHDAQRIRSLPQQDRGGLPGQCRGNEGQQAHGSPGSLCPRGDRQPFQHGEIDFTLLLLRQSRPTWDRVKLHPDREARGHLRPRFQQAAGDQTQASHPVLEDPTSLLQPEEDDAPRDREYLYEPSEEELLEGILPRYIQVQVYTGLLDSVASEHGARMTAMEAATTNAEEMIYKLTLKHNRLRQESITTELMEIVGGAEALKG